MIRVPPLFWDLLQEGRSLEVVLDFSPVSSRLIPKFIGKMQLRDMRWYKPETVMRFHVRWTRLIRLEDQLPKTLSKASTSGVYCEDDYVA